MLALPVLLAVWVKPCSKLDASRCRRTWREGAWPAVRTGMKDGPFR